MTGVSLRRALVLHRQILSLRHIGQLLDERHQRLDLAIAVRWPPGRHAGHLDTVLGDPEDFRGREFFGLFGQIRRLRVQALVHVRTRRAWRCVAVSAVLIVVIKADFDLVRATEIRQLYTFRPALDRVFHRVMNPPLYDGVVWTGRGYIVNAGVQRSECRGHNHGDGYDQGEDCSHEVILVSLFEF